LHALALFYDLQQLIVNLGKTKLMIFNRLKKTSNLHFFFRGEEIKITNTYTYLGVQFLGPCFNLRPTLQPRINKGYESLALLKRQCFRHHFQDISSKMSLLDSLLRPTILQGSEVWGPSLLELDWTLVERVWVLLLQCINRCEQIVPRHVILAEFWAWHFQLETVFKFVSFQHRIQSFVDLVKGRDQYLYYAYFSSKTISLSSPPCRVSGWFAKVSNLLWFMGIQLNYLPPFKYSLNAPSHLLPTKQELNKIIGDDTYTQFIQITWVGTEGGLCPKMAFYAKHFLELRDELIVQPHYTLAIGCTPFAFP